MQVVSAQDMFDEAKNLHSGNGVQKDLDRAEIMYNQILNNNISSPMILYVLGTLHMEKGNHGLAIAVLENVVTTHPKFGEAWNNLGIAWKNIQQNERADECFAKAVDALEDFKDSAMYSDALCNRASMHINQGDPETCLKYAELALENDPEHAKARWHKALGLLELQKWDEAWEWHEYRLTKESADHNIAERNYTEVGMTPWWDGKSPGLIAIHGEQGLGDEIMFSSCIPDMRGEGREFVFEPSPRTHNLFKRSFEKYDDIHVHGSHAVDGRDWIGEHGRPAFKIALGSLPKYCRRKDTDFPGTPFLLPAPIAASSYGKKLKKLGPRKKIGIAWQGGVESTAVHLRSVFPKDMKPILEQDADFISLQYTTEAENDIKDMEAETGLKIHHWPEAVDSRTPTGRDLDHLAALISKLDMVISVCQTCIHMAGALGIPCLVLTPSKPSWRYGVTGNYPWFNSVDLIRQEGDWDSAIQEAADRLKVIL